MELNSPNYILVTIGQLVYNKITREIIRWSVIMRDVYVFRQIQD